MTEPFTDQDADRNEAKPRSRGTLPYLPNDPDAEQLRGWLTLAFRPPRGWRVSGFERMGRDKADAARLLLVNGRENKAFRFDAQRELMKEPRATVTSVADGWLKMPHLTPGEVEDVWAALCTLGRVMTEHDDAQEAREWIEQMLPATIPLTGHTLVPDGRHAALMAIKQAGEFSKSDAMSLLRPGEDSRYQQRPTRFVDAQTGEQWLRVGETATFVRWVVGVEPLPHKALRARLYEIGIVARLFEDYHAPHPKAQLYGLPEAFIEGLK